MSILYLSLEQIIAIHDRSIAMYGGTPGMRDRGLVEASAHAPRSSAGLEDAYKDLFSKAAALLRSFVSNHGFVDGNKRVGFMTAYLFLQINGYIFDASEAEKTDFVYKVACGAERDIQKIADWLKLHCSKNKLDERTPIFDVKVNYEIEGDFSKGVIEFKIKAGFLKKKEELLVSTQERQTGCPAFKLFKPKDHEDHLEVVFKSKEGAVGRSDFKLGEILPNADNKVTLRFEEDKIHLTIDEKPLLPIDLDE